VRWLALLSGHVRGNFGKGAATAALLGPVPGIARAFVAAGRGVWGIL